MNNNHINAGRRQDWKVNLYESLYKDFTKEKNRLQCLTIFTVMPPSSLFYGTTCSNGISICIILLPQAVIGVRLFSSLQFSRSVMSGSLQPH